jgi:hypothetical protein
VVVRPAAFDSKIEITKMRAAPAGKGFTRPADQRASTRISALIRMADIIGERVTQNAPLVLSAIYDICDSELQISECNRQGAQKLIPLCTFLVSLLLYCVEIPEEALDAGVLENSPGLASPGVEAAKRWHVPFRLAGRPPCPDYREQRRYQLAAALANPIQKLLVGPFKTCAFGWI